jgi:hypothetical protein
MMIRKRKRLVCKRKLKQKVVVVEEVLVTVDPVVLVVRKNVVYQVVQVADQVVEDKGRFKSSRFVV